MPFFIGCLLGADATFAASSLCVSLPQRSRELCATDPANTGSRLPDRLLFHHWHFLFHLPLGCVLAFGIWVAGRTGWHPPPCSVHLARVMRHQQGIRQQSQKAEAVDHISKPAADTRCYCPTQTCGEDHIGKALKAHTGICISKQQRPTAIPNPPQYPPWLG